MSSIQVKVVSAEAHIFSGDAEMLVLPGLQGDLGITPGHTPLLTQIRPGALRVINQGHDDVLVFVSGGFAEVQPNMVTVLADTAVRGEELSEAAALAAKEEAEKAIAGEHDVNFDYAAARAELVRAVGMLQTIRAFKRSHR